MNGMLCCKVHNCGLWISARGNLLMSNYNYYDFKSTERPRLLLEKSWFWHLASTQFIVQIFPWNKAV